MEGAGGAFGRGADTDDSGDARVVSAFEDGVQILGQFGEIEVSVRINQHGRPKRGLREPREAEWRPKAGGRRAGP